MKMRSFTRSLVCASLLALVSTGVNAAEKVTLKLAHNPKEVMLYIRVLKSWRKR